MYPASFLWLSRGTVSVSLICHGITLPRGLDSIRASFLEVGRPPQAGAAPNVPEWCGRECSYVVTASGTKSSLRFGGWEEQGWHFYYENFKHTGKRTCSEHLELTIANLLLIFFFFLAEGNWKNWKHCGIWPISTLEWTWQSQNIFLYNTAIVASNKMNTSFMPSDTACVRVLSSRYRLPHAILPYSPRCFWRGGSSWNRFIWDNKTTVIIMADF